MLDQLRISKHDLGYAENELQKARQGFARDYYDNAVREADERIPRYEEEDRKERERTAARNRWINELKASIK